MDYVACGPQLVGESEESVRLTLCVVEQEDLGHSPSMTRAPLSVTSRPGRRKLENQPE
jgi:hypothetical protein